MEGLDDKAWDGITVRDTQQGDGTRLQVIMQNNPEVIAPRISEHNSMKYKVATWHGQVVGLSIYEMAKNEIILHYLAVEPSHRRMGIGTHLLEDVITLASQRREKITMITHEISIGLQKFMMEHGVYGVSIAKGHYGDRDGIRMDFRPAPYRKDIKPPHSAPQLPTEELGNFGQFTVKLRTISSENCELIVHDRSNGKQMVEDIEPRITNIPETIIQALSKSGRLSDIREVMAEARKALLLPQQGK